MSLLPATMRISGIITGCSEHFIFFGERYLRCVANEFVRFFNTLRPHQAKEKLTLPEAEVRNEAGEAKADCDDQNEAGILKLLPVGEIVRHKFLSGLLNNYERVAA